MSAMKTHTARLVFAFAALMLAIATALGAIASHALDGVLDPGAIRSFETGVEYQFVHSLGLLALALWIDRGPPSRALGIAAILLAAGVVLFSGGVYASSLDGPGWIAALAPAGGISLITGWLVVAATLGWQFIDGEKR